MTVSLTDGRWVGKVQHYQVASQTGTLKLPTNRRVPFKLEDFLPVVCQAGDEIIFYVDQGEIKTASLMHMDKPGEPQPHPTGLEVGLLGLFWLGALVAAFFPSPRFAPPGGGPSPVLLCIVGVCGLVVVTLVIIKLYTAFSQRTNTVEEQQYRAEGRWTTATVTSGRPQPDPEDECVQIDYSYQTQDGKSYSGQTSFGVHWPSAAQQQELKHKSAVGTTYPVRYLSSDPHHHEIFVHGVRLTILA